MPTKTAAVAWARSVDVTAEICRPRALFKSDYQHHPRVVEAMTAAYATVLRVAAQDLDDDAGFNLLSSLFLIMCCPNWHRRRCHPHRGALRPFLQRAVVAPAG